jgi:hypothetical protein
MYANEQTAGFEAIQIWTEVHPEIGISLCTIQLPVRRQLVFLMSMLGVGVPAAGQTTDA